MPRRPATFTQADVARVIRAAKQTGAGTVTLLPDGTIKISISPTTTPSDEQLDDIREIIL